MVVLIGIAVPGASDVFAERAGTALSAAEESSSTDPSLQYRVNESDAVYALAGRNLWTGIGPTSGFVPVNSISLPTDGSYTHNTYLTLPLRYGLWGILGAGDARDRARDHARPRAPEEPSAAGLGHGGAR